MNVAVGLQYWISSKTLIATNYTMFCAGGVVVALPVTILFMLLQRYYVEGGTGGAVKGKGERKAMALSLIHIEMCIRDRS